MIDPDTPAAPVSDVWETVKHIEAFCRQTAADGIMPSLAWFDETVQSLVLTREQQARELKALDTKWAAASLFIRDIIWALAQEQPAEGGVVDLPALTLQVIGQIEDYKARLSDAEATIERQRTVLLAAWQDIQDWCHTARGLREQSKAPKGADFDPACPSAAGIEASEAVLQQIRQVIPPPVWDILLTPPSDTTPTPETQETR